METRTRTHGWRAAALLATLAPLVAACGGHGGVSDGRLGAAAPRMPQGSHLVISTDNGVRLRPADGDRVALAPHVTTHWSRSDRTWALDLSCTDREGHEDPACPRMPVIAVPSGTSVTVTARNAGVDAVGVGAELDLTTVNGDVTVTRSGRDDAPVRLVTRNGSVRTEALRSGRLHAETVNGDVTVASATSPAGLTAATTNGSVRVTLPRDAPGYLTTATARNGRSSVTVPAAESGAGHEMSLSTVNGDVTAARG
ncbi:DUF4097 family beta strand repeat-containing protein [Streptomyces sp. NPDC048301]|uniref:DUF4097 family beta strand repeat-containing protein n=1 Tax=Streptomyces sp. NPDC048301 TaxID=3155631 RepID=UPI00342C4C82